MKSIKSDSEMKSDDRHERNVSSFNESTDDERHEHEEKRMHTRQDVNENMQKNDNFHAEIDCEGSDEDTESDDDNLLTLLQSQRYIESQEKEDDVIDTKESDEAWREDDEWQYQEEVIQHEGAISHDEIVQAKFVLRNLTSRIPLIEDTAIRRGVKLSGPPLEFATTHVDEYARKFRWPLHVRNLRNTNFSQDPTEIFEDFELLTRAEQSSSELPASSFVLEQSDRDGQQDSAFAQIPRPMVALALAAAALRRSIRKRKRTSRENAPNQLVSAHALLNLARVGGQFSDHFVESLLAANGRALQGIDSDLDCDMDKRCWSSLPTKKKPIANWRFVLEHLRKTNGRMTGSSDAMYPPMTQETLERITKRLKILHGCTVQHEEDDIFKRSTPTSNDVDATEATREDQTGKKS